MARMSRLCSRIALACACLLTWSYALVAQGEAQAHLLLRDPSLSRTEIAFSYAGNIWIANRDGSDPRRLTSAGHEAKPAFSPDGSQVAFVGDYDGARAVYVVPARGGEPRRLTYHPADLGIGPMPDMVGWAPDGKRILFNSRRATFFWHTVQGFTIQPFFDQLFTVSVEGGFATQIPLAGAAQASFSPDAARVAYVPNAHWQLDWKRYRGGQTMPIWIANLADSGIEAKIPRDNSNDFNPMWVGNTIYFLSDRNGPVTLFAYDVKARQVKQIVQNDGLDIKSASATSDAIVYEQFGSLHLLDLKSGDDRTLDIRPAADLPEVRPHFKKIEPSQIRFADLSPNGERAVFGARGEILTVPAGKGDIRNLSHTTDVVERDPAWSPDGKSIAYFSDESGEYALHIINQSGLGNVREINLDNHPAFYYSPSWSPDSTKIAYTDQRLNYWYVDLEKKVPVRVDTDLYTDPAHNRQLAWSPDSRWIAYTKQLPNHLHAVFVYSLEQATSYQLTDSRSDALHVAFDKDGQYLYFTAGTDAALSTGSLEMTSLQRPVTRSVYAILLDKNLPSPMAPARDEEKATGGETTVKDGPKNEKTVRTEIDLDGINKRIVPLPIPARNYYDLTVGKPGVLFLIEGPQVDPLPTVAAAAVDGIPTKVQRFDLKTRKTEQILDEVISYGALKHVSSFHLSFSGEKMLYAKRGKWYINPTDRLVTILPEVEQDDVLKLDSVEVYVDPRAEWKHMYEQVWRDERDFFYDPGLHGLNLAAIKEKYEPYLENISTREDLNYLFSEMLGNITVGHMVAVGGDSPAPKRVKTGLLGADYSVDNGRYRFARIYSGDLWDPEIRAPLSQPGANVQVGEYLLAVNGRDVRPTNDVYSFFEDAVGKQVVLTVSPKSDGAGARPVTVIPIDDETPLRNFAWVEDNRRKVDELSSGRVAYVYLPDTLVRGYMSFNREYFAQVGKNAVIIDDRYNDGGMLADYVIDYLRRPLMNYWNMRYGKDITSPQEAIFGPKVMIINDMAGSGGDYLAWLFRHADIGPLIGKRTWGGLVGSYTNPVDLLDGGIVSSPNLAFYNPNGTWDIENHGVSPDMEVEDDPKAERQGHDPQLERALAVVLELLRKSPPPPVPQHPPYPNYQKRGQ